MTNYDLSNELEAVKNELISSGKVGELVLIKVTEGAIVLGSALLSYLTAEVAG